MSNYTEVSELLPSDHIMIVRDGCIKIISAENFIKDILLGGFNFCQSWKNCVIGIGDFGDVIPSTDTRPVMNDIAFFPSNRAQGVMIGADFANAYYDADGDAFGKIIVKHGDVSGYHINGVPIYIGQVIPADQVELIKFNAKDQGTSYHQEWFFEAYDINNVKAD